MKVPGRLESLHEGQPFNVFVDYAHTSDALKNILSVLKEVTDGRLLLVFGCGGDRDQNKRPEMTRAAQGTVILRGPRPITLGVSRSIPYFLI